uniref:biotin--[acetyl-CoA-carboxylase] ligase n=1 Tax=Flavobacterium sp. TaxID=239 RepID=UPI0040498046
MQVIKLDATNSTNDYLKKMALEVALPNFTVVAANYQTAGKGQMGASWVSEKGKNLIFSVLIKDIEAYIPDVFLLNKLTTLVLYDFFEQLKVEQVSIKWPNDIMSGSKKIAGILIENIFKQSGKIDAIVGIGINVNQTHFEGLPSATSLKLLTNNSFDLSDLLNLYCQEFKSKLTSKGIAVSHINNEYNQKLFKRNKPAVFEDKNQNKFMGIIQGVNVFGELEMLLDDDSVVKFKLKEIKMFF